MKMKPNLKMGSIQDLFLEHVEKVVLAVAVLVFVALALGAVKRDTLTWGPDELKQEVDQARKHIAEVPPPPPPPPPKVDVEGVTSRIDGRIYAPVTPWRPSPFDKLDPRNQPSLFALESLRAGTGYGSVKMQGGAQGKRWVVLTALLPTAKQRQVYQETFANVAKKRPSTDQGPIYLFYTVERSVENPAGGSSTAPNWQPVNAANYLLEAKNFSGTAKELAPPQFLPRTYTPPYSMVFPLPPVENRAFGTEVVHEPEIPIFTPSAAPAAPQVIPVAAPTGKPGVAMPPLPAGLRPDLSTIGAGESSDEESSDESSDESSEEEDEEGGSSSSGVSPDQVEYQLFRFFDFDVQPGKQYRYRVKLVLHNPNYKIESRYLAKEELGKEEYLLTEWSEPSNPVVVPPDARLLAGPIRPSVTPGGEPSGKLLCIQFEPISGIEASGEFPVYRGQVADFLDQEKNIVAGRVPPPVVEPTPVVPTGPGAKPATTPKKTVKKPPEKINFLTEMVVLDMRGGGKLPGTKDRTLTEPGFMLLLDTSGNMVVKHEILDQDDYIAFKPPEKKPGEKKAASSEEESSEDSGDTSSEDENFDDSGDEN